MQLSVFKAELTLAFLDEPAEQYLYFISKQGPRSVPRNSVCSWSVFWNLTEMVTNAPNVVGVIYIKQKGNNFGHL